MVELLKRYFEISRDGGHAMALATAFRWLLHALGNGFAGLCGKQRKLALRVEPPDAPGPLPPGDDALRVLVVSFDYPQLSESYIHAEIRWLLAQGVNIEAFRRQDPRSPGIALVPVHSGDLEQCIHAFRPDIIHVHWISQARQYAAILSRSGAPVTVRSHGFDHSDSSIAKLIRFPWMRRLYLFPNLLPEGIQSDRFATLAAVVDTSRYYLPARKDRRLVLRAGACLPTKDLELFIDVAAIRPEYRFVLALATNHAGAKTAAALKRHNEAAGSPVDILFDQQNDRMGALMREASVYLHTFGHVQPFGQPISIAEAMACGTLPLLRDSPGARAYAGDTGFYYASSDQASAILQDMLTWDDARWAEQSRQCAERALATHADHAILPPLLNDWTKLAQTTGTA